MKLIVSHEADYFNIVRLPYGYTVRIDGNDYSVIETDSWVIRTIPFDEDRDMWNPTIKTDDPRIVALEWDEIEELYVY